MPQLVTSSTKLGRTLIFVADVFIVANLRIFMIISFENYMHGGAIVFLLRLRGARFFEKE